MNTTLAPESDAGLGTYGYTTFFQPLTTIFTPPTQCYTLVTLSIVVDGYEVFGSPTSSFRSDITPCLPSEASSTILGVGISLDTQLALGPFTCPYGYTLISTRTEAATRTASTCCPSGYTYSPTASTEYFERLKCTSVVPAGMPFQGFYYNTFSPTSAQSVITFTATGISGYNILHQFAPATSTGISNGYVSMPAQTGTKIGLGVGITLGIIVLAGLLACLSLRSRRKQRSSVHPLYQSFAEPQDPGPLQHEMASNGIIRPYGMHQTTHPSELAANHLPAELQHASNVYELPSPTTGR